jgi:hypothetical protein
VWNVQNNLLIGFGLTVSYLVLLFNLCKPLGMLRLSILYLELKVYIIYKYEQSVADSVWCFVMHVCNEFLVEGSGNK